MEGIAGLGGEVLHRTLLALNLFELLLGLAFGFGFGFGRQHRALGLLDELLVFVNEGLALLVEFLDLLLGLLFGIAQFRIAVLGLIVAVVGLGHVDHDQFQCRLRQQCGGTGSDGSQSD